MPRTFEIVLQYLDLGAQKNYVFFSIFDGFCPSALHFKKLFRIGFGILALLATSQHRHLVRANLYMHA
jgi:hypothetical protein